MTKGEVRGGKGRFVFAAVLVMGFMCLLEVKALQLQVLSRDEFLQRAKRQYFSKVTLPSKRGRITDREGRVLAISLFVPSIYALPDLVEDKEGTARCLSEALGIPLDDVRRKLYSFRKFVWIKRHVSPEELTRLKSLNLKGISAVEEPKRFYPYKELAGPLLGFVGVDHEGLEGIEKAFDSWLKAPPLEVVLERDALGRFVSFPSEAEEASAWDLRLTIDIKLQYVMERELKNAVEKAEAQAGVGMILDPYNGEVLAMASVPSFNPNCFQKYPPSRWKNLATLGLFEPGSLIKPFLVGAALEERVLGPEDVLFCEGGKYRVADVTIRDVEPHHWLTVGEVIQYSSNIGAAKIALLLGSKRYYSYLKALGFGQPTGIGVAEERGILRLPRQWTTVDLANLGFGQGASVTPLQLAVAYAAIANGGMRIKPLVVSEMISTGGREKVPFTSKVLGRVYSKETTEMLMEMLKRVVSEGTGTKAKVEGYEVAGKTGTAQKYEPDKGLYSRQRYVASFVGILPADRPMAVVLIMLDEPKRGTYGGEVAAPAFKSVAEELLKYWGIVPKGDLVLLSKKR